MTKLPKIVRERLKAAGPVGNHPDPDLLTAFAEQSLPALERASVLEHVSRCRDCRQVLALATPALETTTAESAASGSSRNWLRWPALRWGAAAACFVVVGAAVLLERNYKTDRYASLAPVAVKVSDEKQMAEEKGAAISDMAMQKAVAPSPAQPESAPIAAKDLKTDTVKKIPPAANFSAVPKSSMTAGVVGRLPTAREEATAEAKQRSMSSSLEQYRYDPSSQQRSLEVEVAPRAPAPSAAPAPAPPSAEAGVAASTAGSAASGGMAGALVAKKRVPGRAKASPVLDRDANTPQGIGPSREAVVVTGGQVEALPVNGRNVENLLATAPRWTISADGQLQRSLDSGKTWEIVPVMESSSLGLVSAQTTSNSGKEMRAPLSEKAKARVEPPPKANPPKFRALSANGNDVWVGGNAGLLYHSDDAGMHWTRVNAVVEGVTLAADIITLDFADAQHGRFVASTGETWVTSDGGKSWKKQ